MKDVEWTFVPRNSGPDACDLLASTCLVSNRFELSSHVDDKIRNSRVFDGNQSDSVHLEPLEASVADGPKTVRAHRFPTTRLKHNIMDSLTKYNFIPKSFFLFFHGMGEWRSRWRFSLFFIFFW